MAADLFNNLFQNPSNDYINPDLAPCPGSGSDTNTFEFLPNEQVGIVSGSSIINAMGLGDISQPVEGWYQQTKYLQPGEVIFIQGLTKGISIKKQCFPFDGSVLYTGEGHPFYMSVDLSINYYKNFKYYDINVHADSDSTEGLDIASALNIKFDSLGIGVNVSYDPSQFIFSGDIAGYTFDIHSIDVSLGDPDASSGCSSLIEDISCGVPAFKYPNGAMLGYVLKITYPSTASEESSYVKINHVPDYLEYYTSIDVSQFISESIWETSTYYLPANDVSILISGVTWNSSTYYDASGNIQDVSLFVSDASYNIPIISTLDVSLLISPAILENLTTYDASGLNSVDVSIVVADASWSAQIYYTGTFRTQDISIFTTAAIWEASTYYIRHYDAVDVGLSGVACTEDTLSAADYLNWIEVYNKWEKVGALRMWLTASDPTNSSIENLITGFYVFNPQTFPVKLDYMTIL